MSNLFQERLHTGAPSSKGSKGRHALVLCTKHETVLHGTPAQTL